MLPLSGRRTHRPAAMIYVIDLPGSGRRAWDLRSAEAGANVLLAQPKYDVVFERSLPNVDGVVLQQKPSQVAVDLMTGPGRNPSEAEELIGMDEAP